MEQKDGKDLVCDYETSDLLPLALSDLSPTVKVPKTIY